MLTARRALGGSLWECGWPGLPGAGQAGCGGEDRSETVGGPRALPLLARARARGLPSERSCAQFGRLQGHARVSRDTHASPCVSVVFTARSLLVVNGVQRGGLGQGPSAEGAGRHSLAFCPAGPPDRPPGPVQRPAADRPRSLDRGGTARCPGPRQDDGVSLPLPPPDGAR